MFDHLSDPHPPDLSDDFRDRVVTNAHRRQRRTRITVGSVALTPLLALGGIALYLRDQAGELERIEVVGLAPADTLPPIDNDPLTSTPPPQGQDSAEANEPPPLATPLTILITGVDRRPPGSQVTGSRADTIAVVRIDPNQEHVGILSLPRDLLVTTGRSDEGARINSISDHSALVETVSSLLNLDINHYVEVDFDGFQSLIDLVGGVAVPFDHAVRDAHTGFTAEPGCNTLTGEDALAYVRSRHLEQLNPATGQWTADPRSDLGRISRQQDLMRRVYASVLGQDYSTTDKVRMLTDVIDDITVDTGLDLNGLRAIFNAAALIGPDNIDTYDLTPTLSEKMVGGASVLVADPTGIATAVDQLLATTTPPAQDANTPHSETAIDPVDTTC